MSLSVSKLSVICRTEHALIHALDEVDLELAPGTSTAFLIGETGSGKSALSMISSGSRLFDGRGMDEWIRSDCKPLARRMGVVYQNPAESFSHRFTVFGILTEPLTKFLVSSARGTEKNRAQLWPA